jgi:hypothetical protein
LIEAQLIKAQIHHDALMKCVARARRRGDRPPTKNVIMGDGGYIYLVNVGRQGIRCLLAVKNGVGVAT